MSCIVKRLLSAPRAVLPHQNIAQRRDGFTNKCVGTRIAPIATSREERGAGETSKHAPTNKTNTTCLPPATRAQRRLARGSKKKVALTVTRFLCQLNQEGQRAARAPENHQNPSKRIYTHPTVRTFQSPSINVLRRTGDSDRAHMGKRSRAGPLSNQASDS